MPTRLLCAIVITFMLDNVLVAPDGDCDKRAALYTDGRDAKDPLLLARVRGYAWFSAGNPHPRYDIVMLPEHVPILQSILQSGFW
jgi:hypothetical protein